MENLHTEETQESLRTPTEQALDRGIQGERLRNLLEVIRWHQKAKGGPVKLNGEVRCWNMDSWDCGTAACGFGSYALSEYGKPFFEPRLIYRNPVNRNQLWDFILRGASPEDERPGGTCGLAADHFGITYDEAEWLFDPGMYNEPHHIPPHKVIRRIRAVMRRYGHADRKA